MEKEKEGRAETEKRTRNARAPLASVFTVFRSRATDRPLGLGRESVSRPVTRQPSNARHESSLRPVVGERERETDRDGEEEEVEVEKRTNERIGRRTKNQATVRVKRGRALVRLYGNRSSNTNRTNHTRVRRREDRAVGDIGKAIFVCRCARYGTHDIKTRPARRGTCD